MDKKKSTPPKQLGDVRYHLVSRYWQITFWVAVLVSTTIAAVAIEMNGDGPIIWWCVPLWAIGLALSQILRYLRQHRKLTIYEKGLEIVTRDETIDLYWNDVEAIRYDSLGLLLADHGGQAIRPAFGLSPPDKVWVEQHIFEQIEPRIFEQLRSQLEDGQTIEIDNNLSISSQCLYIQGKAVPWTEVRSVKMKEVWGLMERIASVLFIYYYDTLHRMPMAPVRNAIIFKRLMDYYMHRARSSDA